MSHIGPGLEVPIWTPDEALVHIGTMNPADKRRDSYEGHGLSVSTCPHAWEEIARLGGSPWWVLERSDGTGGRFLDLYRLDATQREHLFAWAAAQGLAQPVELTVIEVYDSEADGWLMLNFVDAVEAQEEFQLHLDDHDAVDQHALRMSVRAGWVLTESGRRACGRDTTDPAETLDLAAVLWAETRDDLDGVYWDDSFSPATLSATRAVVLPPRLDRWRIAPAAEQPEHRARWRA